MDTYGLIGFPLGHSFSKKYFDEKFKNQNIDAQFYNYEIERIELLLQILKDNCNLKGLCVTIPYKEKIFPFLDEIDTTAKMIGAVNSVKIVWNKKTPYLVGYNTDCYGFGKSLDEFLGNLKSIRALILGTGGASKAVKYALQMRNIPYTIVSRTPNEGEYSYEDLNQKNIAENNLIINTTPLGTFPKIDTAPNIPYEFLTPNHFLFDLVYNPIETSFLLQGKKQGAKICNGYKMLIYQAECSWDIWSM